MNDSKKGAKRYLLSLFICFILLVPAVSWSGTRQSTEDIKVLYHSGRYDEVIASLVKLEEWNAFQSLYLGLSYLRLGDSGKAIDAWKNYVRLEKGSEGGRKIARHLTLLIQNEAKDLAQTAVQKERLFSGKLDPKAIAVIPLTNLGDEKYAPLSKGLAAMIITDLSKIKAITVVERIQIQAILNELKLSKSGLVDKKSGPRVGKLLGAGKVTTGSYIDLAQDKIRLDVSVTHTEEGRQLTSAKGVGLARNIFQMEKEIVFKILIGIGHPPESLDSKTRKDVLKVHTKNMKAFLLYSEGLDAFDRQDYRQAGQKFFLALEEDPAFDLAREFIHKMPILPLDLGAVISGGDAVVSESEGIDPGEVVLPISVVLQGIQQNIAIDLTSTQIFQEPVCGSDCSAGAPPLAPLDIVITLPGGGG